MQGGRILLPSGAAPPIRGDLRSESLFTPASQAMRHDGVPAVDEQVSRSPPSPPSSSSTALVRRDEHIAQVTTHAYAELNRLAQVAIVAAASTATPSVHITSPSRPHLSHTKSPTRHGMAGPSSIFIKSRSRPKRPAKGSELESMLDRNRNLLKSREVCRLLSEAQLDKLKADTAEIEQTLQEEQERQQSRGLESVMRAMSVQDGDDQRNTHEVSSRSSPARRGKARLISAQENAKLQRANFESEQDLERKRAYDLMGTQMSQVSLSANAISQRQGASSGGDTNDFDVLGLGSAYDNVGEPYMEDEEQGMSDEWGSRQIGYVLDQKDSRTKLRLSRLLSEVAQEPSTSSSEWHKLCVRISSLLHANQDVAKGLMLAMEMVENVPWEIITPHVSQWISSALTHFHLAIVESCAFLDNVLGQDAKAKAEYWRNTGSVQVPKYALALLEASREIDDIDPCLLSVLLQSIRKQVRSHPATYRIHATELQSLCTQLLCRRADLTSETGSLLSALHLTGKGQDIQCQLWKTTLKLLIDDAEIAWQACSSTFGVTRSDEHSGQGLLGSLPTDDMEALELAHQRLTLLLGQPPTPGIIAAFLSEPTQNVVPVPLDRLVSLVLAILSITPSSTPSQTPPPEATLLAAQTAMLPAAHVAALSLLANLPISVAFAKRVQIVSRVLRVIEKSSATIRCVAFRTLLVLDIPLNPESDIVIHCTRTCLAQAARLIHAKEGLDQILAKTTNGKTSGREIGPAKRRKVLYESDQVQFTQSRGFVDLCEDEYAGCITAIRLIPSLYGHLATHLSAEHHDLAHTTALVLLGVSEIALRRPDDLSDASLTVLAAIVRLSRGSILALLTTRAASLACQGLIALHHDTRQAAKALTHALEFTFNPRLPPKLSLRVHVAEDSRPADASETVLGNVELDEESGRKEWEAMRDVLQVQPYEPRSPSQYLQRLEGGEPMSGLAHADSPGLTSAHRKTSKAAAAGPPLSPDPVKPLHRPTTPRIGSPLHSASTSTGTTLSAGLSTASRASSISPERSSTNAHLFGGTSTSPIQSTSFPTSAASPHIQHQQEVQQQHRQQVSTDEDNISHADSDESALPEIDMRSSDEESEEEQS